MVQLIAVAVVAAAMTNVVVFTPIGFMSGIVGQFYKQFGLTVVFATIFSLFMSFTLTPMLASKLLKKQDEEQRGLMKGFFRGWDNAYDKLAHGYRGTLEWSLKHRWVIVLSTIVVFFFSIFLFPSSSNSPPPPPLPLPFLNLEPLLSPLPLHLRFLFS